MGPVIDGYPRLQARIQELADGALQHEREEIIHRLAEELANVHAAQSALEQDAERWRAEAGPCKS